MHIEAISNGLGAPSMYLVLLAQRGIIPATFSITADTGAENDRLMNTGERITAGEYFARVVEPLCHEIGITPLFARARDKDGAEMPGLEEWVGDYVAAGKLNHVKIPLFGSDGGRLRQACTGRMKVAAIRQTLRRLGATSARQAMALHRGEVRRMKGANGRVEAGFYTLNDMDNGGVVKWASHYYPMIDRGETREHAREQLDKAGIPWLLSSECDFCPHQDWARWSRHTEETIARVAAMEAKMDGQFFFTDKRIPLREALPLMQAEWDAKRAGSMFDDDPDFGCNEGAVCGV